MENKKSFVWDAYCRLREGGQAKTTVMPHVPAAAFLGKVEGSCVSYSELASKEYRSSKAKATVAPGCLAEEEAILAL